MYLYSAMVRKKVVKCSKCGDTSSEMVEEEEFKHAEKIQKILKSNNCLRKENCLV